MTVGVQHRLVSRRIIQSTTTWTVVFGRAPDADTAHALRRVPWAPRRHLVVQWPLRVPVTPIHPCGSNRTASRIAVKVAPSLHYQVGHHSRHSLSIAPRSVSTRRFFFSADVKRFPSTGCVHTDKRNRLIGQRLSALVCPRVRHRRERLIHRSRYPFSYILNIIVGAGRGCAGWLTSGDRRCSCSCETVKVHGQILCKLLSAAVFHNLSGRTRNLVLL